MLVPPRTKIMFCWYEQNEVFLRLYLSVFLSLIRSPLGLPSIIESHPIFCFLLLIWTWYFDTYQQICPFRLSKEAREMIDIGKVPVRSVSKNLEKMNTDKSNTEKEKKRIARKKERRATLILGKVHSSNIQESWITILPISFPLIEKIHCIFHTQII